MGSGLGLAIVEELTTAMGGDVSAVRRPGGGAEFLITVPTAEAEAGAEAEAETRAGR